MFTVLANEDTKKHRNISRHFSENYIQNITFGRNCLYTPLPLVLIALNAIYTPSIVSMDV